MEPKITPETARVILELRADEATQARVDELGRKANDGTLTTEETIEYENYVKLGTCISLMQADARKYLNEQQ